MFIIINCKLYFPLQTKARRHRQHLLLRWYHTGVWTVLGQASPNKTVMSPVSVHPPHNFPTVIWVSPFNGGVSVFNINQILGLNQK